MSTETRRRYKKRRRAELEAETRRRITEATVKLHGTVGPARTTVKAIADEARVQRATVYRHFPDTQALFEACTAHYRALHPVPDAGDWERIGDPEERLRVGLGEVYAWYGETEGMRDRTSRDAPLVPEMQRAVASLRAIFERMRAVLLRGRRERGRGRVRAAAAIGHALSFATWRSLVREQDLGDEEAVELMVRMVAGASRR
jgi:AcrR family transcriptional regulator